MASHPHRFPGWGWLLSAGTVPPGTQEGIFEGGKAQRWWPGPQSVESAWAHDSDVCTGPRPQASINVATDEKCPHADSRANSIHAAAEMAVRLRRHAREGKLAA